MAKIVFQENKNPMALRKVSFIMTKGQPAKIVPSGQSHLQKSSAHSEALAMFPYVQLTIIILFAIFAYIAFSSTKQNEQNRVWVGLCQYPQSVLPTLAEPYCPYPQAQAL